MRKIWICGANGMLGSQFTSLLTSLNFPHIATCQKQADITDLETVSDLIRTQKITHVINCAAYTQVDQAEKEQKEAYLVNAIGAHYLAIASRRHAAKLLHFSTDYVFNGLATLPYKEDDLCSPIGAYGMSKMMGEMKILAEHPQSVIIRSSWLFGPFGKNFVSTMVKLMSQRDEVKVVADQIGKPTSCLELAKATLALLDEEGIFHFANPNETTWFGFAQEIYRQATDLGFELKAKKILPISSQEYPTAAKRPSYSTLSTEKFEKITAKKISSWQEALQEYLLSIHPQNQVAAALCRH